MTKAGHKHTLILEENRTRRPRKARSRKVTWYNPPWDNNVKGSFGKKFLQLVDKHFPKNHELSRILNRSTLKISYSTMPNMKNIINAHNREIINREDRTEEKKKTCNCRQKNQCPLNGECLAEDIVYKATVETHRGNAVYVGLASGQFKTRYNNHTKSFRHQKHEKDTELSKFIWEQKRSNTEFKINWSIAKKSNTKIRYSGTCNLCLDEKIEIMKQRAQTQVRHLNKRTELISACRHRGYRTGVNRRTRPT